MQHVGNGLRAASLTKENEVKMYIEMKAAACARAYAAVVLRDWSDSSVPSICNVTTVDWQFPKTYGSVVVANKLGVATRCQPTF